MVEKTLIFLLEKNINFNEFNFKIFKESIKKEL